jgi:hypothetical protein
MEAISRRTAVSAGFLAKKIDKTVTVPPPIELAAAL